MKKILAIDPGLNGAFATNTLGNYWFGDLPTMELRGGKRQLNCAELKSIITTAPIDLVIVEQVASMPRQGVSSVFSFGMTYGMIQGVVIASGLPMVLVLPAVWKRHHGLINSEKDAARTLAIQRHPTIAAGLARKKDVDRADAILMLDWAIQTNQ